jgi:putative N-acetylmannosamine-6-phosphate epimerase
LVVVAGRFGMREVVVEELVIREITSAPIIGLEKQHLYCCCWSRMK